MKDKNKPKYNIAQNIGWMVKLAWQHRKRVLLFCLVTAILEVGLNLTQLYIAPEILSRVEAHAPLRELLGTIGFFTLILFLIQGFTDYVNQNTMFPRVDVRTAIIGMLGRKSNMTSYPNTLDADYIKLREKAHMTCEGNREATECIWHTLTQLLKNIGGFIVYLTILSHLEPLLLLVVIATCLGGFLVSRYTNNWMFTHREEEDKYYAKKRYIRGKAQSVELAKDIRIFGLQN